MIAIITTNATIPRAIMNMHATRMRHPFVIGTKILKGSHDDESVVSLQGVPWKDLLRDSGEGLFAAIGFSGSSVVSDNPRIFFRIIRMDLDRPLRELCCGIFSMFIKQ